MPRNSKIDDWMSFPESSPAHAPEICQSGLKAKMSGPKISPYWYGHYRTIKISRFATILLLWIPKKIEIQDVEDFEERESDSNEDEFCPECNNYVGKKGSFIKNNFKILYFKLQWHLLWMRWMYWLNYYAVRVLLNLELNQDNRLLGLFSFFLQHKSPSHTPYFYLNN